MLESKRIDKWILVDVRIGLKKASLMMHGGTVEDAIIVVALSFTVNKESKHGPEKQWFPKGNQCYCGIRTNSDIELLGDSLIGASVRN